MSDPSVRAMTDAQWVFEFQALQRKEEMERKVEVEMLKTGARIFRDTLITVLGLHLFPGEVGAEREGDGPPPFTPATLLFSNHHLLKMAVEQLEKKTKDEDAMSRAQSDAAFEEFSQRLARGDVGDMDPILLGADVPNAYWNSEETQQMLKLLGVTPRPASAAAVPHIGRRPAALDAPEPPPKGRVVIVEDETYRPGLELEPGLAGGDE